MDLTSKRKASVFEQISFYLCNGLGTFVIVRNLIKLHRYCKSYELALSSLHKYRNNIDWIENVKNRGKAETVLL